MSVSSSDCSMIPSMRVARASSASAGACPAGVWESRPYRPVIDSPSRIGR